MAPKEKKEDYVEGAWAAFGFSLVLIIVGLPVWWWTTTVYRAGLPYTTIDELALHRPYHTLHLTVVSEEPYKFKNSLKSHLQSQYSSVQFVVSTLKPTKQEATLCNSNASVEAIEAAITSSKHFHEGTLTVYVLLPSERNLNNNSQIYVSSKRVIFVVENVDMKLLSEVINSMSLDPLAKNGNSKGSSLISVEDRETHVMRQVPTEPGYDVTITLMLPQPYLLMADWDAKEAVRDYLEPLVKQLKNIMDLRIRSQVLYMTSLKVSPKWSSEYKHYLLPEQQLPLTINAIEAKLGSFVSTRPSLHFIIYVPSSHQTPLHIHTKEGVPLPSNSFLVPRWGGVIILNPPEDLNKVENVTLPQTFSVDSRWVMSTVVSHLHKLFPIPNNIHEEVTLLQGRQETSKFLMDWQLDSLARARVLAYLNSVKITLRSLCDLVGEISNMVVSDEVASWVWAAVGDWQACLHASRDGRLKEATIYCREAFIHSDAAFFHPSMLALLYFPDNQKYAIYVPLFLPVSIPVVLSLRMIFKLIISYTKKSKLD